MSQEDSKGAIMEKCQVCGTLVPVEELQPYAHHDAMGNEERQACRRCREGAQQKYTGN